MASFSKGRLRCSGVLALGLVSVACGSGSSPSNEGDGKLEAGSADARGVSTTTGSSGTGADATSGSATGGLSGVGSEGDASAASDGADDATTPRGLDASRADAEPDASPVASQDSGTEAGADAGTMVVDGGTGAPSFHMVNWAVNGDNFQDGPLLLSGITSSSDTYAGVQTKSNLVLNAFITLLGANSVRVPINEPTALTSWWGSYKAVIDTAVAKNMKVVVGYWAWHNGKPDDVSTFYTMWKVVSAAYAKNPLVYFDIHNEPYGYTSAAWIQQVHDWIAMFPEVPQSQVIIAGDQWDDNVNPEGAAFPGYLLQLHIYDIGDSGPLTEAAWSNTVAGVVGPYANRTIVGEWGENIASVNYNLAPTNTSQTTQLNYAYVVGASNAIHDLKMGSGWWPGLWAVTGNISSWGLLNMYGSGNELTFSVQNPSGGGLARVHHSWGLD
jgi:endoglucanase